MRLAKILTSLGIYGHLWPQSDRSEGCPRCSPIVNSEDEVCSIPVCDRIVYAMGFCNGHYQRALKLRSENADRTEWFEKMHSPINRKRKNKREKKKE